VAGTQSRTTRRAAVAASVVAIALMPIACWLLWFRSPPQLGADEEAYKSVDALFTAVTSRDEQRLGQCERRLRVLKEAGKLPAGAAEFLDGVIARARDGRWETAAERLYDFMHGQRREGAQSRPSKKDKECLNPVTR